MKKGMYTILLFRARFWRFLDHLIGVHYHCSEDVLDSLQALKRVDEHLEEVSAVSKRNEDGGKRFAALLF